MSMLLCADTSERSIVVALVDDAGELVAGACGQARAQHLLRAVSDVLREAGASWDDISRCAVGIGPGGFTGLRVGVATMRGLAAARHVSLAPIPTLEVVALGAPTPAPGTTLRVIASVDAQRAERYAQEFDLSAADDDGRGTPVRALQRGPLRIVTPAELEEQLAGGGASPPALHVTGPPTPAALARAALAQPFGDPAAVMPLYGRAPDATPPARQGLAN